MSAYRVAGLQMVSGGNVAANLVAARRLIERAAQADAKLVLLPEYFGLIGARATDKLEHAERDGDGVQQRFLADAAKRHAVIVIGGCVPIATGDPSHVASALVAYDASGRRIARYDKMHLFAYADGDERYDEGRTIAPGARVATLESPAGRVGLSICYDVRFPELYRALGDLALIVVPSAFTVPTGAAHWELLLRARAVENQCYVLAAAQGGLHENGRRTFGHSMLVDPWGRIVAQLDEGEGVVIGDVDRDVINDVRRKLPAYAHRRLAIDDRLSE
ncbi:MAG TPA: carbon-nitrogen hydrolase family protein [Casimicrobiaceae bacterium]|nr:carbon-nitrogen hydrolase family protein [Casimicrobiaceae bacterium]